MDGTAEYFAAVQEGIDDIEAGRFVPYEDVRRWLLSWGTENELPMPVCPPGQAPPIDPA